MFRIQKSRGLGFVLAMTLSTLTLATASEGRAKYRANFLKAPVFYNNIDPSSYGKMGAEGPRPLTSTEVTSVKKAEAASESNVVSHPIKVSRNKASLDEVKPEGAVRSPDSLPGLFRWWWFGLFLIIPAWVALQRRKR